MTKMLRVCAVLAVVLMVASTASANLLGNPGFESPSLGGAADAYGAGDSWTSFGGGVFRVASFINTPNTGDQSLKLFGNFDSGAYQQFPANPGEEWNGGAWIINNTAADPMGLDQIAAVNIEWIQADGVTQSAITPFISNGTFTGASTPDVYTLQTITGFAPADASFARLTLITGVGPGGAGGGAPFYDDAFFELVPEPASFGLLSLGLLSLLGLRRRR